jgi:hypothetical protein
MKTLTATLLAAQKKSSRLPYVEAKAYDYEAGIKRLSWTRVYEGTEPDNHHGIAFDGQGDMHRIRSGGSGALLYQKQECPFGVPASFPLTFPVSLVDGPAFDTWSLIADDCFGPCAIAASGAKVYIFYRHSELNKLYKLYSHDYGETWQNAQLADYSEVASLAACWWIGPDPQSPTPIVVCLALKASYPAKINAIALDTQDQSTTEHEWYDGNHPLLETFGIGATYTSSPYPSIAIVIAGKESDSPYNHYDLFRTSIDGYYSFLALESFLMAPDGEDITYEYPDCHLPLNPEPYETVRILAVERFVGTTPYTRPLTCHMAKGTYWGDTTFTEPRPHPVIASGAWQSLYGLRITSSPDYWWVSKPDGVWRAPRPAADPLDLTKDIISLQTNVVASPDSSGRGNLIIELDNSRGLYNVGEGLVPSLINKRSELVLKLGYKTTAGNEAAEAGTYWVDSWEYQSVSLRGESRSNLSTFTLNCLDAWGLMARWSARYQMRWNKDGANPKSVWQILYQLLARAGIKLTNTPAKPQSSAINNFYPDFTVNPGTQGAQALNKLLSFVPDGLVFRGQEAFTKNPLPTETSCYSYAVGAGLVPAHVILSGQYVNSVLTSRARAIGQDAEGARIVQDAFDPDLSGLGIDILEQVYDPNLGDATRAQERADALLRQMSLRAQRGNLVIPTNVGQELLDVVEVTDARCGISGENYRVQGIRTLYDRRKGQYDQTLALGAP